MSAQFAQKWLNCGQKMYFDFMGLFRREMGVVAMLAQKGLGPQCPTKKFAYWADLLGQLLSRKFMLNIFGTEPPPPLSVHYNLSIAIFSSNNTLWVHISGTFLKRVYL